MNDYAHITNELAISDDLIWLLIEPQFKVITPRHNKVLLIIRLQREFKNI